MKKKCLLLIICFVLSNLNVYAETELCDVNINSSNKNFYCGTEKNKNLSFKANNVIYTKYFSFKEDLISIKDMKGLMGALPTNQKEVKITISSDGKVIGYVTVTNDNYKEPTTTTTTTTKPTTQKYTVTFDHNDGTNEKTERQCETTSLGGKCHVNAPKFDNEKFTGWGNQKECQEGGSGKFEVDKDITYYACYEKEEDEPVSTLPKLNSLKLLDQLTNEEIMINFNADKDNYKIEVDNSVKSIKVVPEVEEGIQVQVVGNDNLKEGENDLTIKLTNEDGKEKIYVFKVTRLKSGEVVDKNHYLSRLHIASYEVNFDKNVKEYTVTIKSNIKELIINAEAENSNDEVKVIGNNNLVNGSTIKINVIGQDGEITIYTINIIKEGVDNKTIIIIAGILIALILILTVIVFIKSNKKDTGNSTKENKKKDTKKTKKVETKKTEKKTKSTKKQKKQKNVPDVLPNSNEDIEILKF